jgi:hypothetical protein
VVEAEFKELLCQHINLFDLFTYHAVTLEIDITSYTRTWIFNSGAALGAERNRAQK